MEKLFVAIVVLVTLAGATRGSWSTRVEWGIGAGKRTDAVVRVECRYREKWELRLRAEIPETRAWRMCVTQDWRRCRA